MNPESRQAIESILMVADQPVEPAVLAQLLEVPKAEVEAACDELGAEYAANGRGFILVRVAGGYRFQSHPDLAPYVERFVLEGQTSRLSSAALETLAIVAYKQPISRMQVAAIRGVNVDGVLRTLQQRGYVDEVDRDPGPGNAVLFGTTPMFLERVGLFSLDDLPPLADFVPGADVVEALEDGLRPEPPGEVAADAVAMAEVEARLPVEVAEVEARLPVEVAEVEARLPVEVAEVEAGSDDEEAIGATSDVDTATEPAQVTTAVTEPDEESGAEVDVDLTEAPEVETSPTMPRAQDLSPPLTSTIRHDVPDNVDLQQPFRSAPGAGTGGAEVSAEAGLGLAEDLTPSPEAVEELNPNED